MWGVSAKTLEILGSDGATIAPAMTVMVAASKRVTLVGAFFMFDLELYRLIVRKTTSVPNYKTR
jgi:hypothetical protein